MWTSGWPSRVFIWIRPGTQELKIFAPTTTIKAGKKKSFEIQLPSGPVHSSFQLLPLKCHLPISMYTVMSIPCQPHHWLGTTHKCTYNQVPLDLKYSMLSTHCFDHCAVFSFEIVFDWKLSLRSTTEANFNCSLDHQTFIFTYMYPRAKFTCPGQLDLGFSCPEKL